MDCITQKREFMKQYVLNRALIVSNMDGELSAKNAEKAWNYIIKATNNENR